MSIKLKCKGLYKSIVLIGFNCYNKYNRVIYLSDLTYHAHLIIHLITFKILEFLSVTKRIFFKLLWFLYHNVVVYIHLIIILSKCIF